MNELPEAVQAARAACLDKFNAENDALRANYYGEHARLKAEFKAKLAPIKAAFEADSRVLYLNLVAKREALVSASFDHYQKDDPE